ncbi:MAG: hypothetical protein JWM81_50 [Candidatus Saccharibacteria bacterium]|nr:hypothetical protein [Candidatus Saccharibacteria bacterium]
MQSVVGFLSTAVGVISASYILFQQNMSSLIRLDLPIAIVGLGLSLLSFLWLYGWLRSPVFAFVLRAVGFAALATAVYSIFSPTFGGLRGTYIPIFDTIIIFEAGIICLLLGDQEPKPVPIDPLALLLLSSYEALPKKSKTAAV